MDSIPIRIVPDTNILRSADNRALLSREFVEATKSQVGVTKRVFIAEITAKEIIYQRTLFFQEFRKGLEQSVTTLTSAQKTIPISVGWSRPINKLIGQLRNRIKARNFQWMPAVETVAARVRKEFRAKKYRVLKTPTKKIDWKRLIDDAVWRRPPFEGTPQSKAEKGFRDALFVETALAAVRKEPEAFWCILSNDGKVVERLNAEKTKGGELEEPGIFQNVEDFQGYVRMLQQKFEVVAAKMLPGIASRAFYDPQENAGLWIKENIETKLTQEFSSRLNAEPTFYEPPTSFYPYTPDVSGAAAYLNAIGHLSSESIISNPPYPGLMTHFVQPQLYETSLFMRHWHKSGDDKYILEGSRFVKSAAVDRATWATRVRIYTLFTRAITTHSYVLNQPEATIREIAVDVTWSSEVHLLEISNSSYEKMEFVETSQIDATS